MKAAALVCFLFLLTSSAYAAKGAGDVSRGNALYHQGKFAEALGHYEKAAQKNPSEAKIEYDLGAAAYKAGDFDAAADHFQKALLTDDDKFKGDVHFNLGDAFYRAGISREEKKIDEAIKQLESSLGSFEKVMAKDPKDRPAAENHEFVKKELERLKQKKQRQQEQQKQQKQQQNKQQDGQQGSKDGQQDQQQQQQQQGQSETPKDEPQGQQDKQPGNEEAKPDKNSGEGKDKSEKDASAGQNNEGKISSQKDANDMIDDIERNELPKGLLNVAPRNMDGRPVAKDW